MGKYFVGWLLGVPVVVLVIVSSGIAKRRLGAPGALGVPFVREER